MNKEEKLEYYSLKMINCIFKKKIWEFDIYYKIIRKKNYFTLEKLGFLQDICEFTCDNYFQCRVIAEINDLFKEIEEKEDKTTFKYQIFIHEDNLSILNDKIIEYNEEFPGLNLKYDFEKSDEEMFELSFEYNKLNKIFTLDRLFIQIDNILKIVVV